MVFVSEASNLDFFFNYAGLNFWQFQLFSYILGPEVKTISIAMMKGPTSYPSAR